MGWLIKNKFLLQASTETECRIVDFVNCKKQHSEDFQNVSENTEIMREAFISSIILNVRNLIVNTEFSNSTK